MKLEHLHTEPPIYLDLDGVFADFENFALKTLGQPWEALPPEEAWKILEQVPHLFSKLDVLPGSLAIYEALEHHGSRLQVLTALPRATGHFKTAPKDKKDWAHEHLSPTLQINTIEGGVNKYRFATPGAVLIDDTQRNLDKWEEVGGVGVLHTDVASTLAKLRTLGLCR